MRAVVTLFLFVPVVAEVLLLEFPRGFPRLVDRVKFLLALADSFWYS